MRPAMFGALAAALIFTTAIFATAPTAHADDQSYLAALDAQGLLRSTPPYSRLETGQKFCNEIRNGASPEDVAARYQNLPTVGGWSGWSIIDELRVGLPGVIATAQRELCPETLR